MKQLVLEGHLCQAGDGVECSYLMLDGNYLDEILEPYGVDVGNRCVKYLPGAVTEADCLFEHFQWDYGEVRITIEFLDNKGKT